MMNPHELLKMTMVHQLATNVSSGWTPFMNFVSLHMFERMLLMLPTVTTCLRRRFIRDQVGVKDAEPSAIIDCERGTSPQQTKGQAPAFLTRMDAVIHYVACSPSTRHLLAIANHDYLPNEFDPVRIDEDVYFKLKDIQIEDGNIKNIKFQLFSYESSIQKLQKFVDSCNQDYERRMLNKLGSDLYFFDQVVQNKTKRSTQNPLPNTFLVYSKHKFSTTRTFNNVYFEEQPTVKKRVEFFLNNRSWYEKKGIPYTLGFMFHGDPGTGKTSEIKAIANVARRHPINIQLSEIKTKTQLRHLFFSDEIHVYNGQTLEKYTIPISERLYVIEDADAMGDVLLKREWKKPVEVVKEKDPFAIEDDDAIKEPIDLAFLLNLLDGTLESSGRIMVVTSNFPERFDRALVRPGRIDMIVKFKKCSRKILREMIEGFYDTDDVKHEIWEHEDVDGKWTPAEVQQILFRNFGEPRDAMDELLLLKPKELSGIPEVQTIEHEQLTTLSELQQ